MAIDSVTSSSNAYASTLQSTESQRNQQAQRTEQQEPKPQERVEKTEEPPKPVVNAQGQTTGTLINVTA